MPWSKSIIFDQTNYAPPRNGIALNGNDNESGLRFRDSPNFGQSSSSISSWNSYFLLCGARKRWIITLLYYRTAPIDYCMKINRRWPDLCCTMRKRVKFFLISIFYVWFLIFNCHKNCFFFPIFQAFQNVRFPKYFTMTK